MPTWEYKTVALKTKGGIFREIDIRDDLETALNSAGRDGWELAQALPLTESHGRTRVVQLVFKRPR